MQIDRNLILKLEKLSRLSLSETERINLEGGLSKILNMFDQLQEVNTENIEPLIYMNDVVTELRKDEPFVTISKTDALKNAPQTDENFILVPQMLNKSNPYSANN